LKIIVTASVQKDVLMMWLKLLYYQSIKVLIMP